MPVSGDGVGGDKCKTQNIGPSGVRALPLAVGINVGGHYKWHLGPSGGSRVRRFGSEDPHRRERKFHNIFTDIKQLVLFMWDFYFCI